VAELLREDRSYIYVCGLGGLEEGVEVTLGRIAREHGIDWASRRAELRRAGRFHVETY
jgi:sulfite reductase alpha subunit-like flavoprotein